jgi:FtsP/CotA-like multicopper oxidase with cupredoxin domain
VIWGAQLVLIGALHVRLVLEGILNSARQLVLVLPLLLTGAGAPPQATLSRAAPNDNRVAAGVLREGVLTIALEVRQTMWYPDGDTLPGMNIKAFAESGKDASVPGPLLRVPAGTEIRGSLRNALDRDTISFYVAARVSRSATTDQLDRILVPPGETRELRFSANTPGTFLYRATAGAYARRPGLRIEGFLAGALIVDSANAAGPRDRVFVLQAEPDLLDSPERLLVLPEVMAINGRSWPHTERLDATAGDTLRWRLINASTETHPMHLHGFFFRVNASNAEARGQQEGTAAVGRMVVTERMQPASTMSISWVPERAGNWLFHCHFQAHVVPHRPVDTTASPSAHADHANHALTGMGGLVMGVLVRPKPGERIAEPGAGRRRLRLVAIRDMGFPDSVPSMRFAVEERGAPRLEAGPGFSPTISLTRGEPVSITVVNRLAEPTAVHWHGIELESYFDGVAGFSGATRRLAPVVAPGDSFEVRMTPPRSGTFIYHSHVDEPRQHRAGLVGALIVRDRAPADSVEEHIFFVKSARAGLNATPEFEINGKADPDTVVLRVGRRYRFRFIGLQVTNPNATVSLTERADSAAGTRIDPSIVQWRRVAKDGRELPEAERALGPARESISMGETYDFEFVPAKRGALRIEVRVAVPMPRLMVRAPIRVE